MVIYENDSSFLNTCIERKINSKIKLLVLDSIKVLKIIRPRFEHALLIYLITTTNLWEVLVTFFLIHKESKTTEIKFS